MTFKNNAGLFAPATARLTFAIALTTAMAAFESLSVSAALPDIGRDLRAVAGLPWTVTAYLLASGLALALAGSVLDRLGTRIVFRYATLVFAVSSGLCAFAPSLEWLVAGRIVQGFASGASVAATTSAIGLAYPIALRSRAFALATTIWGVLAISGPGLAAMLLTILGWRSIFWVNAPISLLAAVLGWSILPTRSNADDRDDDERFRFDPAGALLIVGATVGGLIAVSGGIGSGGFGSGTLPWFFLATVAATLFWRHSGRHSAPILDRRFFARSPFRHLAIASGGLMAAGMGVETFLPLYLRSARDASTHLAAWSVLFLALGWTLGANVAGRHYHRLSEPVVVRLGTAMAVPLLLLLALGVVVNAPIAVLFGLYLLVGIAIGATSNACLTLVQAAASRDSIGRATTAHQFLRNQAVTFGTATSGAVMMGIATGGVAAASAGAVDGALLDPDQLRRGFAAAHGVAFLAALFACVAAHRLSKALTNPAEIESVTVESVTVESVQVESVQVKDQDAHVDGPVPDGHTA